MAKRKRVLARAAVLVSSLGPLFVGSGQAQAYDYDGTGPRATGCASSARTVESAVLRNSVGTRVGVIELRFSSYCKTAWARLTMDRQQWQCGDPAAGFACSRAWIVRNNDGRTYRCTLDEGDKRCWTRQVYDLDPLSSFARGYADTVNGEVNVRTASY
ncbi:DUF2690 domain-containing protein [Streptomyces sp. UG1]|uniref:DUF2690 domain-containing protein n=1 Tax=Streptomyces sp. UG1 TaxID=3417652 RepID=UPI003CEE7AF2